VHAAGRNEGHLVFADRIGSIHGYQGVFSLLEKQKLIGVMIVKASHVIILRMFYIFDLQHMLRGMKISIHGGGLPCRIIR